MTSAAVRTQQITRRFGDTVAVDGVDLEVPKGEIYGFLGPNGAGKSTLVRMLCTLLLPTDGHAEVAGFDVARDPTAVRLRIGVALQDAALDDRQTGRELLRLQGRLYGVRGSALDERVRELEGIVDIGDALDRYIGTYSGGMKRRLDLAAALVHRPQVLFLDEPTTGLDPVSRARVWDEVRRLNTSMGVTIFLTTQYLEEADALADRVGIIDRGRVVAEGSPQALKRSMGSDVIVAELEGDAAAVCDRIRELAGVDHVDAHDHELSIRTAHASAILSAVAVALDSCGVGVRNLTMRTPTLDDVFLELTGGHLHEEQEQ